jgi:hypothetical protein
VLVTFASRQRSRELLIAEQLTLRGGPRWKV